VPYTHKPLRKNMQQEAAVELVAVDPAGVIERQTSGGHHTMDMGMKPDLLIPESKITALVLGWAEDSMVRSDSRGFGVAGSFVQRRGLCGAANPADRSFRARSEF
jgi:hypothetical protein